MTNVSRIAVNSQHEALPIADKKRRVALRRDPASRAPFRARRARTRAACPCREHAAGSPDGSGGRRSAHHDQPSGSRQREVSTAAKGAGAPSQAHGAARRKRPAPAGKALKPTVQHGTPAFLNHAANARLANDGRSRITRSQAALSLRLRAWRRSSATISFSWARARADRRPRWRGRR